MGSFLLRAAVTGFALWVVTLIVSGISFVGGNSTLQRAGIIFVVPCNARIRRGLTVEQRTAQSSG
jgi:uncharacterized membrane protein YvlD (DUF360 family)